MTQVCGIFSTRVLPQVFMSNYSGFIFVSVIKYPIEKPLRNKLFSLFYIFIEVGIFMVLDSNESVSLDRQHIIEMYPEKPYVIPSAHTATNHNRKDSHHEQLEPVAG